ncbi:MAG: hypothetical protein US11_C0003G0033 [Candidatus Roizmanbacteria bacterium GW2011_GWA2_36_23]|uniref:Methyltransferase type 11 domain-containing protein n=1 Tax=Candidatus Roizmanbacteria bacterium GW2011_GWA2_36_23 TaxID=1618480 RepID=A0A0G0EL88_9BACT|nr:MAG: hypothetical protein US11_C0003G0033 [Candidatus Roizmanbacteria bacterium GW2011_GWA2_36_23]
MTNNIEAFANKVLSKALDVSTGQIFDKQEMGLISLNDYGPVIKTFSKPQSDWTTKVDEIEKAFADQYDQQEYPDYKALTMMGLFEVRNMLSAFGITSLRQTDFQDNPLADKKFLNVGCGTGREAIYLSALGAQVTAFDATEEYVRITADKIARTSLILNKPLKVELGVSLAEAFPYPANEYDGITSLFGVINHVEFWQKAIRNMGYALKPDGKLVIEKYGSNDALVYKAAAAGIITYEPSVFQTRESQGKGIFLGKEGKVLLPACFPDDTEFKKSLEDADLDIESSVGFLRIAAIFPKIPTPQNIESFMETVRNFDEKAWIYINKFNSPIEKLFAAFEYDLFSQRQTVNKPDIEDFAYVLYKAKKKTST